MNTTRRLSSVKAGKQSQTNGACARHGPSTAASTIPSRIPDRLRNAKRRAGRAATGAMGRAFPVGALRCASNCGAGGAP